MNGNDSSSSTRKKIVAVGGLGLLCGAALYRLQHLIGFTSSLIFVVTASVTLTLVFIVVDFAIKLRGRQYERRVPEGDYSGKGAEKRDAKLARADVRPKPAPSLEEFAPLPWYRSTIPVGAVVGIALLFVASTTYSVQEMVFPNRPQQSATLSPGVPDWGVKIFAKPANSRIDAMGPETFRAANLGPVDDRPAILISWFVYDVDEAEPPAVCVVFIRVERATATEEPTVATFGPRSDCSSKEPLPVPIEEYGTYTVYVTVQDPTAAVKPKAARMIFTVEEGDGAA